MNNYKNGFIDIDVVLTLIFITLKLTKVIDWPWIWVLCPLWGGFLLYLLIILILFLVQYLIIKRKYK